MKNYKRIAALAMAATMVVGSGFTAMAADAGDTPAPGTGGATGSGEYEGYVEEVSAFSVEVPTDAGTTAGFNFFVDPNKLLEKTGYASKGGNANEFDVNSTLFFTRTIAAGDSSTKKYGNESDAITFTNKSSYDVDVEVAATVTGADGITLGEVADDAEAPTIELAIKSGSDTPAVITADGGKLTGKITGTPDNFSIQYKDNKYQYAVKDDADDDAWQTYSFNLTGACGGTWTDAQAEAQPSVNLTWKVTDPKATPTDDFKMTAAANGDISYTFSSKPQGAVTEFKVNGISKIGAYTAGNVTYDAATGVLTVKSAAATNTGLANGGNVEIKIGENSFTLTYTK